MKILENLNLFVQKHGDVDDKHEGKKFFHYCDFSAAKNILQKKEIWATYIKHSNDKSEFRHGMDLFKNYITKLPNSSFSFGTLKMIENYYNAQTTKPSIKPYIFCFSENGDQLSQWRGYANGGNGAAVGFTVTPSQGHHLMKKVIYTEEEKYERIHEIISGFELEVNKIRSEIGKLPETEFHEVNSTLASSLIQLVVTNSCFFKDRTFEEEKEWRIVYYKAGANNTKYRISNGNLINYIEQISNVNFTDLIFGPKVTSISKESFESLTAELSDRILLSDSQIPFQ